MVDVPDKPPSREELVKHINASMKPLRKSFNDAGGATKMLEAINDMWGVAAPDPNRLDALGQYINFQKTKAIREAADKQSGKPKRDLIEMILDTGEKIWWIREEGGSEHIRGPKKLTDRAAEAMIAAALMRGMGPNLKIDGTQKERDMLWAAAQRMNAQNANKPGWQPVSIVNFAPLENSPTRAATATFTSKFAPPQQAAAQTKKPAMQRRPAAPQPGK